jgi:hypothetical protein
VQSRLQLASGKIARGADDDDGDGLGAFDHECPPLAIMLDDSSEALTRQEEF